jgi:hypothetical protein
MANVNNKLCRAAERGDDAEIERQIAAGADPNVNEGTGKWTPLQEAARKGHSAAISLLLKAGARVDGAHSSGNTPLMCAALYGRTAAVNALLAAGADVHGADIIGHTALHRALMWGNVDTSRVLLEAGARTDVRNSDDQQPIDVVRCAACPLGAAARSCLAATSSRCHAQIAGSESTRAAICALFASAAPWCRRRPAAIACYAGGWEWEA